MPHLTPDGNTVEFQHQADQLLGGTTLQKVVEIGAVTGLSGIYFETRVLAAGYDQASGDSLVDVYSRQIEESMLGPYVTDMSYFQDTTQAGQLLDMMQIFWSTADQEDQGWIMLILAKVQPTIVNPCVQNAVAAMLGQGVPYPDANCSPTGFSGGQAPTVPPGGMPHA